MTGLISPHVQYSPEVIKNPCSTQLSMKFFLLIYVKIPTTVGIFTFKSRKNMILRLPEPETEFFYIIIMYL